MGSATAKQLALALGSGENLPSPKVNGNADWHSEHRNDNGRNEMCLNGICGRGRRGVSAPATRNNLMWGDPDQAAVRRPRRQRIAARAAAAAQRASEPGSGTGVAW